MRFRHGLLLIWLTFLSRVSAERPQTVIATIPSEGILGNAAARSTDEPLGIEEDRNQLQLKDFEVTGFITKSGDIFELPAARSMGSIQAREEPELEAGMTMCRYGNIVVYSDADCNSFFRPSDIQGRPPKSQIQNDQDSETDVEKEKPAKKKNKPKKNKRKPNKNKKKRQKKNKNRRKQQRKKGLKKKKNQKRRRNKLKNGAKRGGNSQKKNKRRVNKKRNDNNRRRINKGEGRSDIEGVVAPLQFTILLNPH